MSNKSNKLYEFAGFRFDVDRAKLWHDDELILLSPKVAELLALLLENNGAFISKEEIFEKIWTDTFVEDGVLTQNIYVLRKTLGKSVDGGQVIENKTRLGYRITVPITTVQNAPLGNDSAEVAPGAGIFDTNHPAGDRNWRRIVVFAGIAIFLSAALGFVSFKLYGSSINSYFRTPIDYVKFTKLSNSGDVTEAALSPDGKFVAFVKKNRVFLRDVISEKEIPLEIPNISAIGSLQFSEDGNFLYFCDSNTFLNFSKILKVPRFGGDTVLIAERNLGRFAISSNGKLLAYYTYDQTEARRQLLIIDLATDAQQVFEIDGANKYCLECAPSWSPDGRSLIYIIEQLSNQTNQLFALDVASGRSDEIKLQKLRRFKSVSWFPDGASFVLSAASEDSFHLWKVYFPAGDAEPITNGLDSFENPIVSKDGKVILTLQKSESSNLFLAQDPNLSEPKQITSGSTNNFGKRALIWADDSNLLYSAKAQTDSIENFWLMDIENRSKRQITTEKEFRPNRPVSDGRSIYFNINRNKVGNISRVDSAGGNRSDVTNFSDGSRGSPQISPDGTYLYYIFRNLSEVKIMRWNLMLGQEEDLITSNDIQCGFLLALSHDGKYLACPNWRAIPRNSENLNTEILIMSVENKAVSHSLYIARTASGIRFSPDSSAIEYVSESSGGSSIIRHQIDGSNVAPIVKIPNDVIYNFSWSNDARHLAIARGPRLMDAVLLSDFTK